MAVILGFCLMIWLAVLLVANKRQVKRYAVATPVAGLAVSYVYHVFMIRCPRCGKSLGHLLRTPTEFSLFRFSKRVRFCPFCTVDFEDDLK